MITTVQSNLARRFATSPVVMGLITGLISFAIGVLIIGLVRSAMGIDAVSFGPSVFGGYWFGLAGWLAGVGVWSRWAKEWIGLPVNREMPTGWGRYFAFTTDHKVIGVQYLVTFLTMFMLAGLLAMLMRVELMNDGKTLFTPAQYNYVMSLHGISMIFVAVAAIIGGFGNYAVPLMIGAEDMAYPRLNALSYWLTVPVPVLLFATFFAGGFDAGWTAYPPLAVENDPGQILFNLAFVTVGLSSIVGSINFIVTIVTMRAPGMTWGRVPIFVWSIFAMSFLGFFFTQYVAAAMLMTILDRVVGTSFFNPEEGGDPILYQHVFWFYSHPAVYIMGVPGLALALEVLTHFSRKPLFAYWWVVGGMMGIAVLSAVVWAHHMFTTGLSEGQKIFFLTSTEIISIPTGLIFLGALGTIWAGRLWLRTPMLFALAVIVNFLIGGLTGVFLADVFTDIHLQDTFFVVAHFHYTIVGAGIFGLFAGIYYWFPKITGRTYSERLAKLHFWWMFIGFNLTFLPMFWLGLNGMNRRVASYEAELEGLNTFASIGGFFLGVSFLIFTYNMVNAWVRGPAAEANPWFARTLEWQTSSPPPVENFLTEPHVIGHPYDYGNPDSPHSVGGPVSAYRGGVA